MGYWDVDLDVATLREEVLSVILENQPIGIERISKQCRITTYQARRILKMLKDEGLVSATNRGEVLTDRFYETKGSAADDSEVDTRVTVVTTENPDGSTSHGVFKDGFADGEGTLTLKDGTTYEGSWENHKLRYGTVYFPNGNWYRGGFSNNMYSGDGEFHWSNGDLYKGGFSNGLFEGQGMLEAKNGTIYTGEFKDGHYEGQGTIRMENGEEIRALFKEGMPYKNIEIHMPDGRIVTGDYQDWQFVGDISIGYPNGDRYNGAAANYKPNGSGTVVTKEGVSYSGSFADGRPIGKTTKRLKDGTTISGSLNNWDMVGDVDIWYPNGDRYNGPVKNDMPNGKGTYIDGSGNRYSGPFVDGLPHGFFDVLTVGRDKITGDMFELGSMIEAKMELSDGCRYEGEVACCRPDGYGTYYGKDSMTYTGQFRKGEFHGGGVLSLPDMKYEGRFDSGSICGRGTYTFPNGNSVSGCFNGASVRDNGVFIWGTPRPSCLCYNMDIKEGTLTIPGTAEYTGHFELSMPNGKGRLSTNGDVYESDNFRGIAIKGKGTARFKDGAVFEGRFNGLGEAEGVLAVGGKKRKCIIHNGERKTGVGRILHKLFRI